jgi:hypothetical protein
MMSARDEVLTYGLIDWVELDQIHRYVAQENAGEPLSVIREKTLDLIRSLVNDGLFEVGDLKDGGGRFAAWNIPLDESMRRIHDVYVTNFADQNTWRWFCWLDLTEKGQQVAEAIAESAGYTTPAPTAEEVQAEYRRLAAASSLVGVVAGYVDDLTQVSSDDLPAWLTQLSVPTGWQIIQSECNSGAQPARVAVYGPQAGGGWDASETIYLFRFTGYPPEDVVYDNSACTLHDLNAPLGGANAIIKATTEVLATPPMSGVNAVRSSGFFVFCKRWVWAQYNTYITGSEMPGQGCMLQQRLYVESTRHDELNADITQLSDAVDQAFITAMNTR